MGTFLTGGKESIAVRIRRFMEFFRKSFASLMLGIYFLSVIPCSAIAYEYGLDAGFEHGFMDASGGYGNSAGENVFFDPHHDESRDLQVNENLDSFDSFVDVSDGYDAFSEWNAEYSPYETGIKKSKLYEKLKKAAADWKYIDSSGNETRIISYADIDEAKRQWASVCEGIIAEYGNGGIASSLEMEITNSLMNELLYDHYSLRNESDGNAAAVIAGRLADDVESKAGKSMEKAFNDFESRLEFYSGGDDDGEKAAGFEQFQLELEIGLSEWDEAERSFINARLEWERNAAAIFESDEALWEDAFAEFEGRRKKWTSMISEKIEEGRKKWIEKYDSLEQEIDTFFFEISESLSASQEQREQILKFQGEYYVQCREILTVASAGIGMWFERWGEKYRGVYSYWKSEDDMLGSIVSLKGNDSGKVRNQVRNWRSLYVSMIGSEISKNLSEAREEVIECTRELSALEYRMRYNLYETVQNEDGTVEKVDLSKKYGLLKKKLDSVDSLYRDLYELNKIYEESCNVDMDKSAMAGFLKKFNSVITADQSVQQYFNPDRMIWGNENELLSWLDTFDSYYGRSRNALQRIYEITGSCKEGTDFVSVEYGKAGALMDYWEGRVEIASQVNGYSKNHSSSADTVNDTAVKLKEAGEFHEEARKNYLESLEAVAAKKQELENAARRYQEALGAVSNAMEMIEAGKAGYDEIYGKMLLLGKDNVVEEIYSVIDSVNEISVDDAVYTGYLADYCKALQHLADISLINQCFYIKQSLMDGMDSDGVYMPSYSEIESRFKDWDGFLSSDNPSATFLKDEAKRYSLMDGLEHFDQNGFSLINQLLSSDLDEGKKMVMLDEALLSVRNYLDERKAQCDYILLLLEAASTGEIREKRSDVRPGIDEGLLWIEAFTGTARMIQDMDDDLELFLRMMDGISFEHSGNMEALAGRIEKLCMENDGNVYFDAIRDRELVFDSIHNAFFNASYSNLLHETGLSMSQCYDELDKGYGAYSAALKNESNEAARKKVAALMDTVCMKDSESGEIIDFTKLFSDREIDTFFQELDEAACGLNDAGMAVLELYKEAVRQNRSESDGFSAFTAFLRNEFYLDFAVKKKNAHLPSFSDFFKNDFFTSLKYESLHVENPYDAAASSDSAAVCSYFLSLIEGEDAGRNECKEKLMKIYSDYSDSERLMGKYSQELEVAEKRLREYERNYDLLSNDVTSEDDGSPLGAYQRLCAEYSGALEASDLLYADMEKARRNLRTAEEIYRWAESEYLHEDDGEYGNGYHSTSATLEMAESRYNVAKTSFEIIEAYKNQKEGQDGNFVLLDENGNDLVSEYKMVLEKYGRLQVLKYEYEEELKLQKERVHKAEIEEEIAVSRLAQDAAGTNAGITFFSVPGAVQNFVSVSCIEDSSGKRQYSFNLKEPGSCDGESMQLFLDYYTEHSVISQDVYGNTSASTVAKIDAAEWIRNLYGKSYTMEDLSLAALYLKLGLKENNGISLLRSDEDPYDDANFNLGSVPDSMHGVNIRDAYDSGRISAVSRAYDKVISNGGADDIARYFLYTETNISSSLEIYERERCAVASRGMDLPVNRLQAKSDEYMTIAMAQLAIAAAFSVILAIPLGLGAWAAVPLAAALAVAGTMTSAANKINEVKSDIKSIRSGYERVLSEYGGAQDGYFSSWMAAEKELAAQKDRLSIMQYGGAAGRELCFSDFERAVKETMNSGSTAVNYSYFLPEGCGFSLKELYENVSNDGAILSIQQAITLLSDSADRERASVWEKIEAAAGKLRNDTLVAVREYESYVESCLEMPDEADMERIRMLADNAFGKTAWDEMLFHSAIAGTECEALLLDRPVRYSRNAEVYITNVFDGLYGKYHSSLESFNDLTLDLKSYIFNILSDDMEEQNAIWENEMAENAGIGNEQWKSSLNDMALAYSAWRNEWKDSYAEKSVLWEDSYTDFLGRKQQWINDRYLGTAYADGNPADYGAVISEMTVSTEMSDSIGKYTGAFENEGLLSEIISYTDLLSAVSDSLYQVPVHSASMIPESSLMAEKTSALVSQLSIEQDMKDAASRYAAQVAAMQIEDEINDALVQLESRNREIEDWERHLVLKAGYSVGDEIYRNAIVDSLAFNAIRKRQTVHRYEWFYTIVPVIDIDVSPYTGNGEYYLTMQVDGAFREIERWRNGIFGNQGENGMSLQEGAFDRHVGKAPVFKDNINVKKSREENVIDSGSGEMGQILLDYIWNSMVNSNGYAELSAAMYDQKLFETSGGFESPTVRSLAAIACDVIASGTGFEVVRYFDDITFTMTDYGMGYKSAGEIFNDVAKQCATSIVSKVTGSAFSGISKAAGVSGNILQGSSISGAVINGASAYASSVASGYVNSFDFIKGTMDWDRAAASWTDPSALASFAGSITGGILDEIFDYDMNGIRLNSEITKNSISYIDSFIGDSVSSALEYAMTGKASVNLLSLYKTGLFEVGIKEGSFFAAISEDGQRLDYDVLKALMDSAGNAKYVHDLKKGGLEAEEILSIANILMYGSDGLMKNNRNLALGLLSGEVSVDFADDETGVSFGDSSVSISRNVLEQGKTGAANIAGQLAYANPANFYVTEGSGEEQALQVVVNQLMNSAPVYAIAMKMLGISEDEISGGKGMKEAGKYYAENGGEGLFTFITNFRDYEKQENYVPETALEIKDEPLAPVNSAPENDLENDADIKKMSIKMENINISETYSNMMSEILDAIYRQDDDENKNTMLGGGKKKDEYNRIYTEYHVTYGDFKDFSESFKAGILEKGLIGQKNDSTIANYGCTLTTAVYMYYVITGKLMTIKKANAKMMENNAYESAKPVEENNLINGYSSFMKAVNTLAGEDIITNAYSNSDRVNDKNVIYEKLIEFSQSENKAEDPVFAHLRVNGASHSVLFHSIETRQENQLLGDVKLRVINPLKNGSKSYKMSNVSSADFYKLTDRGKELYKKTLLKIADVKAKSQAAAQ